MFKKFFVFITFLVFIIKYIHCDIIIVDSNKDIQGFDPNSVLNLSENVFNIFLDTKTKYIYIYFIDIIQQVYKKHPNYISYIITCKESELFDNIEDAKDNKNVFHTNPNILSQLMIVFLIFFFLFIGFYVLINISTPKIYEEKQLIINKEH
ncbi:hypothetical protein PFNF54_01780 [Plasmodium falciparum NF54]|uniref:Uncharacterized protein n=1 Tax=Plasmodium falciparum (isolate NF54) TaxID=5843 RepID=W7JWF7_PLAFO|nr:hypothetical protein PFNF54_01780 [Plasmodium falciparum NF54]